MLKIKDEYDLEILKNFGFEFDRGTTYIKKFKDREGRDDTYIEVSDCDLRVLYVNIGLGVFDFDDVPGLEDTIYDLIKADIVEKII